MRYWISLFMLCFSCFSGVVATELEESPMVLVLLGAPGAGKGTQAVRLSREFELPHISTGDLFRENLKKETEIGKKAKGYMEAGQLVPDELVLDMLFARIQKADCKKGYILDGFPRTVPQAEALSARLGGHVHVMVLNLEVSDDRVVSRITQRRVCGDCGAPFHLTAAKSKVEGVCDYCSGSLVQRSDDTVDVVTERLKVYYKETAPVSTYFEGKGLLHNIASREGVEEVFEELCHVIRGAMQTIVS